MKNLTLIVLSILLINSTSAQTGLFVPDLAILDTQMNNILKKYDVPGGQLAVTYQGRLVYSRGFGYADTSTKKLVQPNSIFRIASVSKSITAAAIMHLVEQNKLSLGDTVFGTKGILNDAIYLSAIDARYYNITIRQLLTHSAGFSFAYPTDPLFMTYDISLAMGVPAPTDSIELIIKWALQNKPLNYNPGTSASYTNFAYAILGKIIEQKTGKKYANYVRDSILKPLKITEMYAAGNLQKDTLPNEVSYYDYAGAPLEKSIYTGISASVPATYGWYNYKAMTPAGGWAASTQDLCRFLVAIDRYTTKPDFWLPKTIDTMLKTYSTWPAYGHGWYVSGKDYYHTGGIQGTASVIKVNNANQLNWAVVFNGLPQNYSPMYTDFMDIVTDNLGKISKWPTHDLWDTPSNIASLKNSHSISISPNPSSGNFTIRADAAITGIEVYNLLGQSVCSIAANRTLHQNILLRSLKSGVYFLKIGFADGDKLLQIVIE